MISMTGFAAIEGTLGSTSVRLELKTLNHRFLDVKIKLPREFQSLEILIRKEIQKRLSRGAIEFRLEFLENSDQSIPEYRAILAVAAHYYESLTTLQKTLGLTDSIRTTDLLSFPDVIERELDDSFKGADPETLWKALEPTLSKLFHKLDEVRKREGAHHLESIQSIQKNIQSQMERIRNRRESSLNEMKTRIAQKVQTVFEAHPLADKSVQTVLESRIAQELALLVDRTDFEEELVRLNGHFKHFLDVLNHNGPKGRKLDFIIQEMHREINTLGNKAQDLQISQDIVAMKSNIEQLREQVMNLE